MNKLRFGFSLIELLIVIAIIGILMGIMTVGLGEARKSSRDAKRKSDLEKIESGINLYRADCNYYPYYGVYSGAKLKGTGPTCPTSAANNTYIEAIPYDPSTGRLYYYEGVECVYDNIKTFTYLCPKYRIWALLENAPSSLPSNCPSPAPYNCGGGFGVSCNYCVSSP